MPRQLVLHSTRPAIYHRLPILSRKLTMAPPPPSKGQSHRPEGNNTLVIISALGALGAMYYYYTRGKPAIDREAAWRKEEETENRLKDLGEVSKSRMDSVAKQGQKDFDHAKATVQARATDAGADLAERARQSAHEAQAKFGDFKNTTERKISDVRDRSEKKFEEEKEEVASQARKGENKARGWFGWGGSK